MPSEHELMERARAQARAELSQDASFLQLSQTDQFERYKNRVNTIYHYLLSQPAENGHLATQQGLSGAMAAADQINKKQLQNDRIDNQGEIAGKLLDRVNFPKFVKDLLTSVFDANLEVTQKQMDKYAELVERIVKPASDFINTIDNNAAIMHIAQRQPNKFKLSGGDDDVFSDFSDDDIGSDKAKSGAPKPTEMKLLTASGSEVDQAELQREIMQAKLELVERHQKLLEQMLLMGITRMVVDSGKVKASVDFVLRAREKVQQLQTADEDRSRMSEYARRRGLSVGWRLFGGYEEDSVERNVESSLEISTAGAASVANSESQTKLHGEVEINFKSDYFPLANFKEILMASNQPKDQGKEKTPDSTQAPAST